MATPVKADISARIAELDSRRKMAMARRLQTADQILAGAIRGLSHPIEKLNAQSQALDIAQSNLVRSTERRLYDKRQKLDLISARLTPPHIQLAKMTRRFDAAAEKLAPLVMRSKERAAMRLDSAARLLEANSFAKVIDRGFALVRDETGQAVKQASALADGAVVTITFADESRLATIGSGSAAGSPTTAVPPRKPMKAARRATPPKDDSQTELF